MENAMHARFSFIFITAVIWFSLSSGEIFSQAASRPDRGVNANIPYDSSGVESINLQNGNVGLAIPLASLPSIAGGKLSFTLKAYYNSKLWNTYSEQRHLTPPPNNEGLRAQGYDVERPRLSNDGGWRIGSRYSISLETKTDFYVPNTHMDPSPDDQIVNGYNWSKLYFVMPDGSKHEIRPLNYQSFWGSNPFYYGFYKDFPSTTNVSMRYYSVDGSFIWLILYPPGNPLQFEAHLPDGTKIQQSTDVEGTQRIIDSNGNKIKIFGDTQGTHYQDEQTGREIRSVTDSAGNSEVWYQTVGGTWKTVEIFSGTTTVRGKFYSVQIPDIYTSQVPSPCTYQENMGIQDITVVRRIVFPQTEQGLPEPEYLFSYNSDETDQNGATYTPACNTFPPTATYPNPSKGLGELSEMTTPTGNVHKYSYSMDGQHVTSDGASSLSIATSAITQKRIDHDGVTDIWTYAILGDLGATVTNPDGSTSSLQAYNHFFGSPATSGGANGLGGLVYRETQSNKVRTERRWARLVFNGANDQAGGGLLVFNPVVTEEYTTLLDDNGNPARMAATTFQYDYNGNVTQRKDYDWFDPGPVTRDGLGIPQGVPSSATVLRITTNSYHNSPASAGAQEVYAKTGNSILNALKETMVGTADTRFSYDNQAFEAAPVNGNITKVANWDNAKNQWVESLTGYDSYGNVISKTDPKGSVVNINYADNTHAMPTSTVVDPQNGTGTQTTSATYDYYTGLPLSSTDINGNVSSMDYANHLLGGPDPFGRVGTVSGPYLTINGVNKRQTIKTYYEDAARRQRVETDLSEEGDQLLKNRVSRDQLGRVILSEKNENGSTSYAISSQTIYKTEDRVVLVSNPARNAPASTDGWTRTTSDLLGRAIEAATFTGASLPPITGTNANWTGSTTTAYSANTKTVTDQAGKPRRSVVNALGELQRVDEPNSAGQLGSVDSPIQPTFYSYDVLGNLTQVQQNGTNAEQCGGVSSCSQSRTFTYNSLSRLLTAANPESGTISYSYDDNGNVVSKTDARSITTNYAYDALNRVIRRSYQNDPNGTPAVTYTYDSTSIANGKGRLTSISSSVSNYSYDEYDALGRVKSGTQTTDGQSYTMSYQYNLAGEMISQVYPSGRTVNTEIDNAGRIAGIKSGADSTFYFAGGAAADPVNRMQYSAPGAVQATRLGNGLWEHTNFNSRLQTTQIGLGASRTDSGVLKLDYSYGAIDENGVLDPARNNGNVQSQTMNEPGLGSPITQNYTYDALNRLQTAQEAGPNGWTQSFTLDRFGNRTGLVTSDIPAYRLPTQAPDIDKNTNRIKKIDSQSQPTGYDYDSAGNLIQEPGGSFLQSYAYDAENRITQAKSKVGGTETEIARYQYDGSGQRVMKVVGTAVSVYVYNITGQLVAEYTTDAPSLAENTTYITTDMLGTPRVLTSGSGQVRERHDYLPFGEEIPAVYSNRSNVAGYGPDTLRQKFTQKERDIETGLDYFLARYHASTQGRFTSPDPYNPIVDTDKEEDFNEHLGQPQNWNKYVYVWNNPLRYTDPNGEKVYVVTYTTGNSEGDDEFKRAAKTKKSNIEHSKGFNAKHDTVLLRGVKTKEDFKAVIREANGLNKQFGKVEQIDLYSHAGHNDGPAFHTADGSGVTFFSQSELSSMRVNWSSSAFAKFYGCYTSLNFAQNFANGQRVPAYGYDRFAYFSSRVDKRESFGSTGPLYLIATDGYENGTYLKYLSGNSESYPMVRRNPAPKDKPRR
jgi:RHS repeat-associated protein